MRRGIQLYKKRGPNVDPIHVPSDGLKFGMVKEIAALSLE